jgi:hypothetical protein
MGGCCLLVQAPTNEDVDKLDLNGRIILLGVLLIVIVGGRLLLVVGCCHCGRNWGSD